MKGTGLASFVRRSAAVACWLVVWQVASAIVGNGLLLAGPIQTFDALCSLVGQGAFWSTVLSTFGHIVIGFALAFALGIALAAAAFRWRPVRELLAPAMATIKSTPVVCIVVLLLIWFGSRRVSGISVFLVVLPAVYFSALEALAQVDGGVDEMLRLHGVSRPRRVAAFVWPSMQPYLMATSRVVVGMSWKAGVAAELIGVPLGSIGERIYQSKLLLETADLFAWTIVVIVLSSVCERLFLVALDRSSAVLQHGAIPRRPTADLASVGPGAALVLSDVDIAYGDRVIANGLTCRFSASSRTCVTDVSGSGKTSLLRVLAGLKSPSAGDVTHPAAVSFAFQDVRLIETLDAHDNVSLVAGKWLAPAEVDVLLAELLPQESLGLAVSELSGGMRRRVEVCRAIACPSQAVLLDEPFASLDEESHRRTAAFVLRHLEGRTLVVATHDRGDAVLLDAQARLLFSDAGEEGEASSGGSR